MKWVIALLILAIAGIMGAAAVYLEPHLQEQAGLDKGSAAGAIVSLPSDIDSYNRTVTAALVAVAEKSLDYQKGYREGFESTLKSRIPDPNVYLPGLPPVTEPLPTGRPRTGPRKDYNQGFNDGEEEAKTMQLPDPQHVEELVQSLASDPEVKKRNTEYQNGFKDGARDNIQTRLKSQSVPCPAPDPCQTCGPGPSASVMPVPN
ncbi:MAG TPA: hypothetical protein VGO93_22930, partial [Candidatus Xenobia bacterium]